MAKSNIEKLMELKQLYEQGILTKEEMEAEKAKILTGNSSIEAEDSLKSKEEEKLQAVIDEIYNDEPTFFERYKKVIFGIVAALILVWGGYEITMYFVDSYIENAKREKTQKMAEYRQKQKIKDDENRRKRVKVMDDIYKEQKNKGNLSLEKFLRNDYVKNIITNKYNLNYYNNVMTLMKKNGNIGKVEVTSDGTYKGHANVSQRLTGVDPYDDWAIDFSYNPNNNQLELKATVFDIPLKNDGSIDNEGIEKEIERLTAESREKEQKEIKEIESQAISIETIIDAYKNNVNGRADNIYYKQEKIFNFYLKKIRKSSSDYEYVMEGSGSSHGDIADILVYTDDSRLANLNFPVKLCFRGALVSISRPEYGDWFIYHFVCTEALTYRN